MRIKHTLFLAVAAILAIVLSGTAAQAQAQAKRWRTVPPGVNQEVGPMVSGPPLPRQSCASQYQSCMQGCDGISPRQQADKPNCLEMCDQIKHRCKDR